METIEEVTLGFKREKKVGGHTAEERARWNKATKPDDRSTYSTVQKIKTDAFEGASQAFARRFEEHQDLIDDGHSNRAQEAAEEAARPQGAMRFPKGWPSLMEWTKGAPLPPDDGSDLEY